MERVDKVATEVKPGITSEWLLGSCVELEPIPYSGDEKPYEVIRKPMDKFWSEGMAV